MDYEYRPMFNGALRLDRATNIFLSLCYRFVKTTLHTKVSSNHLVSRLQYKHSLDIIYASVSVFDVGETKSRDLWPF